MIELKEIQLKLNDVLLKLDEIISQINREINNQDNYFLQTKEIEKTIKNLEKNGVAVPDELIRLKTNLISKTSYFEELNKLKIDAQNKIQKIVGFESEIRKKRKLTISRTERKKIYSFSFLGKSYSVSSWKDFLIKFIEILGTMHSDFATKATEIKGKKRPYFTKDENLLRVPKFIDNIDLYVETNFSSRDVLKIVHALLDIFGYKKQDLKVNTNDI